MFIPVLLFAAAGALIGAGVGGGVSLWGTARRRAAEQEMRETSNLREEALKARMRLKEVEDEATAIGLDPAEVIAGIDAILDGQVSAATVSAALGSAGARTGIT